MPHGAKPIFYFPKPVLTDFAAPAGYTCPMNVIYVDSLFLFNAAVDYLLLLSAGKLCALPLRRGRMALGAALGGAFAVGAALLPGVFGLWTVKLLAGAAAVALAFGAQRRTLKAIVAFFAVAAAFGGAVQAAATLGGERTGGNVPVSMRVLVLSFALCYVPVSLVFRHVGRRSERRLHRAELTMNGRETEFTALEDSGNELTDPMTGCSVLVAEASALAPVFDAPELLCGDAPTALERLAAAGRYGQFRLLPCACVAAERTLLLCFRPQKLVVDGVPRRDIVVAISPNRLSQDGEYQAII